MEISPKKIISIKSVVFIIICFLLAAGGIYSYIKYINYKNENIENEKIALEIQQQKDLEIEKLKQDVNILKNSLPKTTNLPKYVHVTCNDISLDKQAPGYTIEDTQIFLNKSDNKDLLSKLSNIDTKYVLDTYFASQWIESRPECKSYINNLVDSRRLQNKQEEVTQGIIEQQKKLLNFQEYQKCLLTQSQSHCEYLLYLL